MRNNLGSTNKGLILLKSGKFLIVLKEIALFGLKWPFWQFLALKPYLKLVNRAEIWQAHVITSYLPSLERS